MLRGNLQTKNQPSIFNNSWENHIPQSVTDRRTDKVNYRVKNNKILPPPAPQRRHYSEVPQSWWNSNSTPLHHQNLSASYFCPKQRNSYLLYRIIDQISAEREIKKLSWLPVFMAPKGRSPMSTKQVLIVWFLIYYIHRKLFPLQCDTCRIALWSDWETVNMNCRVVSLLNCKATL